MSALSGMRSVRARAARLLPAAAARHVEHVTSFAVIRASGLFDPGWYAAQLGGAGAGRLPGHSARLAHYVWRGRRAGLAPHPLMEPAWFAPDRWRDDPADPFARLLLRGRVRRRPPHPLFDPAEWVRRHPEAAGHRWGPFGHFCATTTPQTLLPVVAPFDTVALTWGDAREALAAGLSAVLADERMRRAVRPVTSYERAMAGLTVRTHAGFSAPGDGPLVSVVMPVRDRAGAVGDAIGSVLAQTFGGWELVVVDDGSADGTAEVVRGLAAADPRIRLLERAAAGVSAARNAGAAAARGRYVAWLDSDNAWRPEFLATMLGAMTAGGLDAGYAISAVRDAAGTPHYRRLDTGGSRERALELLAVSNFIDLNVLVVERELLHRTGGFDETLRRTVDYDLVWRLVEAGAVPRLVPFVGVDYAHDARATDRITVREPPAWREVVKNRHLVDWPALAAVEREDGVSVVVAAVADAGPAWRSAAAAAASEPGDRLEVVVVDDALPRGDSLLLGCLPLLDPRIRVRRLPRAAGTELATNLAVADARFGTALLLREGVEPWPGWLRPVAGALGRPGTAAVQPLLVAPDGTVDSAGRQGAADLFRGLPVADAVRAGAVLDVAGAAEGALAARVPDLAAVRGLDPLLGGSRAWGDLALRLAGGWEPPRIAVVTAAEAGTPAPRRWNAAPFLERWGAGPPGDAVLARAGFGRGLTPMRRPAGPPLPGHPEPVPSLRWSIRISAPAGPVARRWGDLHFARALGAALERLGQQVVLDHRPALHRDGPVPDDVVLTLRGLFPATPPPGAVSLLWVISHPDRVTAEEARGYDRVFAAGAAWAERFAAETGVPVEPLLQATFPDLFHPDAAEADTGEPVLFVGNSRGVYRPIVRALVEAGVDVAIHGNDWERFVGAGRVASRLIPNAELPQHYRRAGIVLNDHWDDMRAGGFVSNRLFDAAACGARVVSDHLEGLGELFGGLVRTYRTPGELLELVRAGATAFPDTPARVALGERIGRDHSFDVRARTLLGAALAGR